MDELLPLSLPSTNTLLLSLLLLPSLLSCCLLLLLLLLRRSSRRSLPSPPRNPSLPFIGETLTMFSHLLNNDAPSFVSRRAHKLGPIFSTRFFGAIAVMSNTPSFHHLLFTHDSTQLHASWPSSVYSVLGDGSIIAKVGTEAKRLRAAIMAFLLPSSLQRCVGRVDAIAAKHLEEHWAGREVVSAFLLLKLFTFAVSCDLLVGVVDGAEVEELAGPFDWVMAGLFMLPIPVPWARHSKAVRAGKMLRQRFRAWIQERRRRRRREGEEGEGKDKDLLSCLLEYRDEGGGSLTDGEVADNVLTLLMAGHDTTRALLTVVLKYMADHKWCYRRVLEEQRAIRAAKKAGEPLNWQDLQRMQYSWWAIQETLRMQPVVFGGWRTASRDIEYEGYVIPKGWKLFWSSTTHHDSRYFREPHEFDPTRFSRAPVPYAFVPFGGGARMCPGNEFARMTALVFLHHLVTTYEWALHHPRERFALDPMPVPSHGLRIKLSPSPTHITA